MARAHGCPCPPLLPSRMSWPHGALLLLWLFSPPLGAGGGGVAVTAAAGGGSPPATSCPAACSCSNQASRVICTRRDLAEVPASIPVNTRYLNLQENGIQVSAQSACGARPVLGWGGEQGTCGHRSCLRSSWVPGTGVLGWRTSVATHEGSPPWGPPHRPCGHNPGALNPSFLVWKIRVGRPREPQGWALLCMVCGGCRSSS